ncbi:hypothetical protein Tco_1547203 [Tanacetum coccineum]
MNEKETSIMELQSLLQTAKQGIKKIDMPSTSAAPVLAIAHNAHKRKISHSNWKGKPQKESPIMGLRERLSLRLDLRVIQRKQRASTVTQKGIRSVAAQNSWVLDIRCGTHIFTVLQGLKKSRKLKHGELNLVMGNKKITLVTKIGNQIPLKYSKDSREPTGKNDKARRGTFLEIEMISKEDSGSKIDLEEVQESGNEEPVVNTYTQQEVVIPVEPDDISLPIH